MFGPTFSRELKDAGLGDLPISWSSEGEILGYEDLDADQQAALDAVVAAHDPEAEQTPVLTKIFKADIWRRCTEAEAEIVDGMLNSQPVRFRRMWNDATFISVDDEMYPVIRTAAEAAFGAARADVLLEPTE